MLKNAVSSVWPVVSVIENIWTLQRLLHLLNSLLYSWRQWHILLEVFHLIFISEQSIKISNYTLDWHDFDIFYTKSPIHVKSKENLVVYFLTFLFYCPLLLCDSSSAVNDFEFFQAYKVIIKNDQRKGRSLWVFLLILIHKAVTKTTEDLLRSIQLYRGG